MFKTLNTPSKMVRFAKLVRVFGRRTLGIRIKRYLLCAAALALLAVPVLNACNGQAPAPSTWSSVSRMGAVPVVASSDQDDVVARAERDPSGILSDALAQYDREVRDYTGMFGRQEIHNGVLQPLMICRFRFRQEPFSVSMHVIEGGDRADRAVFVTGQNDGQMLVHPKGLAGKLLACVAVDPEGKQARKNSSRTIKDFGLRNMLVGLLGR